MSPFDLSVLKIANKCSTPKVCSNVEKRMVILKITYVDKFAVVSIFQVPENGGVVEIGEAGHVVAFLELRRVHLRHLFLLVSLFLKNKLFDEPIC